MSPTPTRLAGWLALAGLVAYCLWPARESLLLTGVPLTLLSFVTVTVLAVVACVAGPGVRGWGWAGAAGLLVAGKLVLLPLVLPTGWAGSYYANDAFGPPLERSVEFRSSAWTRLERRLWLVGNEFPLHFFNETRFNFLKERTNLPFSAVYAGYVREDGTRGYDFEVRSRNEYAVSVDGTVVMAEQSDPAREGFTRATTVLTPGLHRIEVRYRNPERAPRLLQVRIGVGEPSVATRAPVEVRPVPSNDRLERRSSLARWTLGLVDALALGLAAAWAALGLVAAFRGSGDVGREAARGDEGEVARADAGLWLKVCVGVGVFAVAVALYVSWMLPPPQVYVLIPSGNDGLAYEESGRRAILDGWLINSGHIARRAYFYMMGYPYLLSLVHLVFGESLVAVHFFQDLLYCGTILLGGAIARRLFGMPAALLAIVIGAYFRHNVFWMTTYVFRENLVVFLNFAVVYAVLRTERFGRSSAIILGTLMGLNYLTEAINLVLVAPLAVWVWIRSDRTSRVRNTIWFGVACVALMVIVPVRNVIVTGWPTLIATEGPPTLWWANQPPPGLRQHTVEGDFYAVTLTYVRTEPLHFLRGLVRKFAYSLGFYSVLIGPEFATTQFSLVHLLSLLISAVVAPAVIAADVRSAALFFIGLTKWASMVVYTVAHNVDRYEVALATLLIPVVAGGLVMLWRWNRLAPAVIVLAVLGHDYARVSPELANYVFAPRTILTSESYHTLRRNLLPELDGKRLSWDLREDAREWSRGETIQPLGAGGQVYQLMDTNSGGLVHSPDMSVPAPVIREVVIEGGFTGWPHFARVHFQYRDGKGEATSWMNFRVDSSGRVRRYRVDVARSPAWTGTVTRMSVQYFGETMTLRKIRLVPYRDVREMLRARTAG